MRRDSVVSISNVVTNDASNHIDDNVINLAKEEPTDTTNIKLNQSADNVSVTTPSTLNRSNNSSIMSQKSTKLSTAETEQPEESELNEISSKQTKQNVSSEMHRIDIADDDDNNEIENNQKERKKLWKRKSNNVNDSVDGKNEEDGCYNPTFTKSETTVAVGIDDVADTHSQSKKSDKKDTDSSHVQNVL